MRSDLHDEVGVEGGSDPFQQWDRGHYPTRFQTGQGGLRHRGPGGEYAPNTVWAVDFQFDATTDGRPIKIGSIVGEHTRGCLGGLVERTITGDDLINELDRVAAVRGYPAVLRCDNGPELACIAMADWARSQAVSSHARLRT